MRDDLATSIKEMADQYLSKEEREHYNLVMKRVILKANGYDDHRYPMTMDENFVHESTLSMLQDLRDYYKVNPPRCDCSLGAISLGLCSH